MEEIQQNEPRGEEGENRLLVEAGQVLCQPDEIRQANPERNRGIVPDAIRAKGV